ncbi:MAG: hypothetical protein OCD76_19575 [Reichenbachiella sp.]
MKKLLIIILFQGISSTIIGQGINKLEIWGWEGSKEDFVKIYLDSTAKDLNVNYACMVDLQKMGYENSFSTAFINGQNNWDSVERFAIIRPIIKSKFSNLASDSSKNKAVFNSVKLLSVKDSVYLSDYFVDNKNDLKQLLIGTLSSDMMLRYQSMGILNQARKIEFDVSTEFIDIFSQMLSFPDPNTAVVAMKIITLSALSNEQNSRLFSSGALTIVDFLNSNLQTFKVDACDFLSTRETLNTERTSKEWINWLSSMSK